MDGSRLEQRRKGEKRLREKEHLQEGLWGGLTLGGEKKDITGGCSLKGPTDEKRKGKTG